MNFGLMLEEIFYWATQLTLEQSVIYWAIWCLMPSFVICFINYLFNTIKQEEVWFISTQLNLILMLILSFNNIDIKYLFVFFIIVEIVLLKLFSHLIINEK